MSRHRMRSRRYAENRLRARIDSGWMSAESLRAWVEAELREALQEYLEEDARQEAQCILWGRGPDGKPRNPPHPGDPEPVGLLNL